MIWYSLLIFINIYKQKIITRVNSLYNNKNDDLSIKNNELTIKRYYAINNYTSGIDHRYKYKYNNETKLQNENKLAEIKTNFHKKKWLETLFNKKHSMHHKLELIKQYDIVDIDNIKTSNLFSGNLFTNTDFELNDLL
jgi:hypothetical protein